MALTDENGGMVMPVQPMGNGGFGGFGYPAMPMMPYMPYGNNGGGMFGSGDSWLGILFLIALCNGGFGFGGFGGGYGAMMGMGMMDGFGLYPWLNNSQNINDGFRDQQLSQQVGNIQNAVTSGFGDVQTALCGGFAGVNQNICQTGNGIVSAVTGAQNALAQQLYTNQLADLERSYAAQTASTAGMNNIAMNLQNCCCENRAATADLKYTVATEACADRAAIGDALQNVTMQNMGNTNVIVSAIRDGIQTIKDDLCADRLDAERRENQNLRSQLNMATLAASQTAQTAAFNQSLANAENAIYERFQSCPVNTVPVFGNQRIFSCTQNVAGNNGGCGCGGYGFANG